MLHLPFLPHNLYSFSSFLINVMIRQIDAEKFKNFQVFSYLGAHLMILLNIFNFVLIPDSHITLQLERLDLTRWEEMKVGLERRIHVCLQNPTIKIATDSEIKKDAFQHFSHRNHRFSLQPPIVCRIGSFSYCWEYILKQILKAHLQICI